MSELCNRTVRHRTQRETLSRTYGVRMSPVLSRTYALQQHGFKSAEGAKRERVYHGRKFDTVDQLKQVIVLE